MAPVPLEALLTASCGVKEALHRRAGGNAYRFQQLTRLNIPIDDANTAQAACSNTIVVASYDIVAVQPLSERAFAQACTALDVDIISLDLSKRLAYRFKPAAVQAAIARGIHFEILFSPALRDAASRRQLFTNAQALCRETRGKNIIISSGARSVADLRGPYDVSNLGTFLGLTPHQAKNAITCGPVNALRHATARKAYRGTLTIRVRLLKEESL
jgi:ribonuclease P/MRP protein subunit RPP1